MSEKVNVEEWLAIRKAEGLKIDLETETSIGATRRPSTGMGFIQIYQRNATALDENISPEHREATSGFTLAICPTKSVSPFGKDMNPNWRFLRD